jgi:hypothetical protein
MGKRAPGSTGEGVKGKKVRTISDDAGGKSVSEKSKFTGGKCVSENSQVGNRAQVTTPSRPQEVRSPILR